MEQGTFYFWLLPRENPPIYNETETLVDSPTSTTSVRGERKKLIMKTMRIIEDHRGSSRIINNFTVKVLSVGLLADTHRNWM